MVHAPTCTRVYHRSPILSMISFHRLSRSISGFLPYMMYDTSCTLAIILSNKRFRPAFALSDFELSNLSLSTSLHFLLPLLCSLGVTYCLSSLTTSPSVLLPLLSRVSTNDGFHRSNPYPSSPIHPSRSRSSFSDAISQPSPTCHHDHARSTAAEKAPSSCSDGDLWRKSDGCILPLSQGPHSSSRP